MKKLLLLVSFAAVSVSLHGVDTQNAKPVVTNVTPDQLKALKQQRSKELLERTGGRIMRPGTGKGWVAIVDLQEECPVAEIQRGIKKMMAYSDCIAKYHKGSDKLAKVPILKLGEAALKESGANIALVLVSSDDLPPMLIAPEARWGVVNVSSLKDDLPSGKLGKITFESRCRKEAIRAFSILCGGSGSQYVGTIVNAASPGELDTLDEAIPLDNVLAYDNFIKKVGMTKRVMTTYRNACQQGWAPAPTNDIQKAVWDKVHTIPNKPLKIEFDPATQKGKVTK